MVGALAEYTPVGYSGIPLGSFIFSGGATLDTYFSSLAMKTLLFESEYANGNSGATPIINWTRSNVQSIVHNSSVIAYVFEPPANPAWLTLQINAFDKTPTWPGSVLWLSGNPPMSGATAPFNTVIHFFFDGTSYWGSYDFPDFGWVGLAAGGTIVPSAIERYINVDTTGAATAVDLPAAGSVPDGQIFEVRGLGATNVGACTVNAGAGNTIELYATPGTFSGSGGASVIATTTLPGWGVQWRYDLTNTRWIIVTRF